MDTGQQHPSNLGMARRARPPRELGPHYLAAWRDFRRMGQEDAAHDLHVTRSYLSKVENRKAKYAQDLLEAAAELYRCTPAQLLAVDPFTQSPADTIAELIRKAAPEDQQRALAVMSSLLPGERVK